MSGPQPKVGLYLRVSTIEQNTELQRRDLLAYCTARGWSLLQEYNDSGKTGTHANRPGFQRLMQACRQRQLDIVICWKLDRLFRSLKDLLSTLAEFSELGVQFVALKDSIDLTTASGRLMAQLLGAFGEFEAALIRERVRAGLKNATEVAPFHWAKGWKAFFCDYPKERDRKIRSCGTIGKKESTKRNSTNTITQR